MKYSTLALALALAVPAVQGQQRLTPERRDASVANPVTVSERVSSAQQSIASMAVEAVKSIKAEMPVVQTRDENSSFFDAKYLANMPLYTGFSVDENDRISWFNGIGFGGAYTNVSWRSASFGDNLTYKWLCDDEEFTGETMTISVKNFTNSYSYPSLTTTNVKGDTACYVMQVPNKDGELMNYTYIAGGNPDALGFGETGVMTYPFLNRRTSSDNPWVLYNDWGYGRIDPISSFRSDLKNDNLELVGFANSFSTPNAPYAITKMWTLVSYDATADVPLECKIYKVENNKLTEIASGETVLAPGGSSYVQFDLYSIDEEGLQSEDPITIDTPIYVCITGFAGNPDLKSLSPYLPIGCSISLEDFKARGGYIPYQDNTRFMLYDPETQMVSFQQENSMYYMPGDNSRSTVYKTCDFLFVLDATFNWCVSEDPSPVINIPVEGGRAEFHINVFSFENEEIIGGNGLDEWVTDFAAESFDRETGVLTMSITADACPTSGREGTLTFRAPGQKDLVLRVVQGQSSIDGVEADKEVKSVEYYDVMGRVLKAEPVSGMFVRKQVMTDGSVKAVKVVK